MNEKYREVFLTPEGFRLAQFTATKHHVIRRFLIQVLRVDSAVADEDACAIEHVISSTSVSAMEEYLKGHYDGQ
ncbi:hypothetical protein SDC9_154776 [bioreactor metagenome]|uniref:Iron dependent repressor metal binding and dimerisation domain-containing protein n=1 Tax=bioreactor metagenome TaxID=1076179 RepID=A0A645F1G0_9ZZZZ